MLNTISFYKRSDIQEAMVDAAKDREIAIRFKEGFGKRPDILTYPNEILDLAKQGATSFHASEELWENPRMISSDMKRKEVAELRKGWDLILDIDSPFWQISKITAWLIIRGLKDFNLDSVSVKFSGNKGFHIGVPFEAFPAEYKGKDTKSLFPEAPRNIASFLLEYITKKYIHVRNNNEIVFGEGLKRRFRISYDKLQKLTDKSIDELTKKVCSKCDKEIKNIQKERSIEFQCPKCQSSIKVTDDRQFEKCKKCNIIMQKIEMENSLCDCGSDDYYVKFDPLSIIEVDTILISSRHLFRMPYSLHEKSGLCSIPFNPEKILAFEKKYAKPEIAKVSNHTFLDRKKADSGQAKGLFEKAMQYGEEKERKEDSKPRKEFKPLEEAVPENLFPPCIKNILAGLEDGRKRSIFILINFLKAMGWSYDMIEKRIREWNEQNPEPLKETIIIGQLRYHKRKENILPPNCSNTMYYKDLQICTPDNFCKKIKNPVNYAILQAKVRNQKN